MYKLKKSIALVVALIFSLTSILATTCVNSVTASNYSDIQNHWAKDEINDLINKGIVQGKNVHGSLIIDPDKPISRAEFIALVLRSKLTQDELNKQLSSTTTLSFKDTEKSCLKDI